MIRSPFLSPACPAGESGRTAASSAGDECGILRLHADAQQAGPLVFALFHLLDAFGERRERHGKTDARVVPFDARHFARGLRRHRHDNAQHAAADIDQRPAVVRGGDIGIGLNRFAKHAADRADDADGHVGAIGAKRASDGDGPLAGANFVRPAQIRERAGRPCRSP